MDHWKEFTKPNDAQAERLAMLAEEASELSPAAMKALRHGLDCYHPDMPHEGNADNITREITDLMAVVTAMVDAGDIEPEKDITLAEAWENKLEYSHHQKTA